LKRDLEREAAAPAPREEAKNFRILAAQQGVVPLATEVREAAREPSPSGSSAPEAPAFVCTDEDGWLAGWRARLGSSAVRGLSKRAPKATLDLHGFTLSDAHRAVMTFVRERRQRGDDVVRLVVGRGTHSEGGVAVLRGALPDWLTGLPIARHVAAFVSAAPRRGGSGAVMVLLQTPESPALGKSGPK
jgi:DNA-nicking Smr family endonuclease